MSTDDIEKGRFWSSELHRNLKIHRIGIFCITPENSAAPWLAFEAGALANKSGGGKVVPLLLGLVPTELRGPLELFQITTLEHQDMLRLVRTLNVECIDPVPEAILFENFKKAWPELARSTRVILGQSLPGDEATVNSVVRALARQGIDRASSGTHVYFDSGFETHALYTTVTKVAGNRLLIFGRKNRKIFDKNHSSFLRDLKVRISNGFDFRVLFLDSSAPEDVLRNAHRDDDLVNQLHDSCQRAYQTLRNFGINAKKHCKTYKIPRTVSFMVVDQAVLYASLALDEKGRTKPLTRAPFALVNAVTPVGADMVATFDTLWKRGSQIRVSDTKAARF
jgi:hypothetical protein